MPFILDGNFIGAVSTYVNVSSLATNISRKSRIALIGLDGIFSIFCMALGSLYFLQMKRRRVYLTALAESETSHRNLVDFMPYPIDRSRRRQHCVCTLSDAGKIRLSQSGRRDRRYHMEYRP
jgi:hypothetical protein